MFVFFNGGSVNTLQSRGLGIVSMFLDMGDFSLFHNIFCCLVRTPSHAGKAYFKLT